MRWRDAGAADDVGAGEEFHVSRYDLSQETDIRPLVVETVITYLEIEGLLQPTRTFYESTQVQFLRAESDILTCNIRRHWRRFLAGSSGRENGKFRATVSHAGTRSGGAKAWRTAVVRSPAKR